MHPNFLDKLAVKIYPRYLYPGQTCELLTKVYSGVVHKLPDTKTSWRLFDHLYLQASSRLKFLGLAKQLGVSGDIQPNDSVFEAIHPVLLDDPLNPKQVYQGDIIIITPSDRQFVSGK